MVASYVTMFLKNLSQLNVMFVDKKAHLYCLLLIYVVYSTYFNESSFTIIYLFSLQYYLCENYEIHY